MRRAGRVAAAMLALAMSFAGCAGAREGRGILTPVYFPGERPELPVTSALSIVPGVPMLVLGTVLGLPAAPFAGRWSLFVGWLTAGALLTPAYVPFWIVGNSADALLRLPERLPDVPSTRASPGSEPARTPSGTHAARSENTPARSPGWEKD